MVTALMGDVLRRIATSAPHPWATDLNLTLKGFDTMADLEAFYRAEPHRLYAVRRCRLPLSNPRLKAPGTKHLKLKTEKLLSNVGFNFKHTLKAPGTKHSKLKTEKLLSNIGFKFNLRRYTAGVVFPRFNGAGGAVQWNGTAWSEAADAADSLLVDETFHVMVGRCRLTLSNPR